VERPYERIIGIIDEESSEVRYMTEPENDIRN